MVVAAQGCRPVPYARRRPENTALYQLVQQHLETYLALAREEDWGGYAVPAFVEREFRRYPECGVLAWENGGFSLDASVRIAGRERAGLERLLRYCARPPFALERIEQVNEHQVIYHLPKPRRDGRTALSLSPLELIDQLAALIPPPRLHRHRYHGVLAPNSPLRGVATAYARDAGDGREPAPETLSPPSGGELGFRSPARYLWAMLLARLFESLPLVCSHCGADMRIVAFITEAAPVQRILKHIGEPAEPPRIAPARGPPMWDDGLADAVPDWDVLVQPEPEYVFNQQVQW